MDKIVKKFILCINMKKNNKGKEMTNKELLQKIKKTKLYKKTL